MRMYDIGYCISATGNCLNNCPIDSIGSQVLTLALAGIHRTTMRPQVNPNGSLEGKEAFANLWFGLAILLDPYNNRMMCLILNCILDYFYKQHNFI